jgi:SPP1 gp7 family putative phage head morphogenesis protein
VEKGLSHAEMMRGLEDVFGIFGRNRLEMIARTETAKVYEQAQWHEMDETPEVVGYQYSAIMDSRVCPICSPRHGKIFAKDEIAGNLPPMHPQCRCMVLAVFGWELADGTVSWDPIPEHAEAARPGFGKRRW